MSGFLEETDEIFPGCRPDDWKNPFVEYDLKTPSVLIARTLAGIIERKGDHIVEAIVHEEKRKMLEKGYGWPIEAIDLFMELIDKYDMKMVGKLRVYVDRYLEYYGGDDALNKYLERCKRRYSEQKEKADD